MFRVTNDVRGSLSAVRGKSLEQSHRFEEHPHFEGAYDGGGMMKLIQGLTELLSTSGLHGNINTKHAISNETIKRSCQ